MVAGGDAEHPEEVGATQPGDHAPRERHGEDEEDRGVQDDERDHRAEVVVLALLEGNYSHSARVLRKYEADGTNVPCIQSVSVASARPFRADFRPVPTGLHIFLSTTGYAPT